MSKITDDFVNALHSLEESKDVDTIASLFSDDAKLSNPLVKHAATEGNPAEAFWSGYREAFETIHSEFLHIVDGDGAAFLEWRSEGSIDGKPVNYGGVSVLEMSGDKITAFRAYFDSKQLTVSENEADDHKASKPDTQTSETPADLDEAQRDAAEQRAEGGYS